MARKNTTARGRKTPTAERQSNTMWGGRYKLGPAEIMEKINASIGFDRRLYAQDIEGGAPVSMRLGPDGDVYVAVLPGRIVKLAPVR